MVRGFTLNSINILLPNKRLWYDKEDLGKYALDSLHGLLKYDKMHKDLIQLYWWNEGGYSEQIVKGYTFPICNDKGHIVICGKHDI